MRIFYYIAFLCIIVSCNERPAGNSATTSQSDTIKNSFARGFKIIRNSSGTTIEIYNPWQNARNVSIQYNLVSKSELVNNMHQGTSIHVPVKRAICMSTTYISFIDALGEINTIVGVSGSKYINNPSVQKKIRSKEIFDVGYEQTLNYEMLVNLKPDVLFVYGVGGEISGYMNKFKEMGIPVILVGDYLESDPLAKAEWIKFFAEFYNKQDAAQIEFDSITDQYIKLKKIACQATYKPSVIVDLPWNGSWNIAGGKSYLARLIKDAGGNYIWRDNDSHETIPIDLETVFHQALNSDFWINIGIAKSKQDILTIDSRFGKLNAFKTGNLYNNNARQNKSGGNDYWESGAAFPQMILKDLIVILHPELLPGQKLYFYKKIY
jgi:iron complex transport system substrate-binding protein